MNGRVRITYDLHESGDPTVPQRYGANLEYNVSPADQRWFYASSTVSFTEARRKVIALFKALPNDEEVEVG